MSSGISDGRPDPNLTLTRFNAATAVGALSSPPPARRPVETHRFCRRGVEWRDMHDWFTPAITARFWQKVDTSGECWLWTAGRTKAGYGKFCVHKHTAGTVLAHRFAYAQLVAPIPDGRFVCHHCDNPSCVRPDHLFLGDAEANMQDMSAKARGAFNGSRNPGAARRWVPDRACLTCGKLFRPKAQQVHRGQGRYCSKACMGLGQRGTTNPNAALAWAKEHPACVACGTTERPHRANGLCGPCYLRKYKATRRLKVTTDGVAV